MEYLAMRAQEAGESPPPTEPAGVAELLDDQPGEGLEFELIRLKRECLGLGRRVRQAVASGHLEEEAVLHRILDQKRETLRKLAKDEPGVAQAAGDVVPIATISRYLTAIRTLWEALPRRIATMLPDDLRSEVREQIDAEIEAVLSTCRELKLDDSAA